MNNFLPFFWIYTYIYIYIYMYLSLSFSLSCSSITVSELFFGDLCNLINSFITSQITSYFCCFLNCSFRGSFKWICSRLFGMIKKILAVFATQNFTDIFINIVPIFLVINKKSLFTNIRSLGWTQYCIIFYILHFR